MLFCRHKTAFISSSKISFFCPSNAPRLRHNWWVLTNFLQSSSFNQFFYPNITHNSQHHLTYLIHASEQFTQNAYFNLFSDFLFIINSTKHNFCSHIRQLQQRSQNSHLDLRQLMSSITQFLIFPKPHYHHFHLQLLFSSLFKQNQTLKQSN